MLSRRRFATATATVAIALVGTVIVPSAASASTHHSTGRAGKATPNGTSWTHTKPGGTSWTHRTPGGTAWTVRTPAGTAWT
jgi:hypothetical protein